MLHSLPRSFHTYLAICFILGAVMFCPLTIEAQTASTPDPSSSNGQTTIPPLAPVGIIDGLVVSAVVDIMTIRMITTEINSPAPQLNTFFWLPTVLTAVPPIGLLLTDTDRRQLDSSRTVTVYSDRSIALMITNFTAAGIFALSGYLNNANTRILAYATAAIMRSITGFLHTVEPFHPLSPGSAAFYLSPAPSVLSGDPRIIMGLRAGF